MSPSSASMRLTPRAEDDLMRLFGRIRQELQASFQRYGIHPLPGQMEELEAAVQEILTGTSGSVTVVPLVPGGGKSTLLRAFLTVAAQVLADMSTPLSQKLGGVVVVVEKSDEGHQLAELCNRSAGSRVAAVVESPNDANLRRGQCYNGSASCFAQCLRRRCPDRDECPLMQAAGRTMETPILILLHARYQRFAEDMTPFLFWDDGGQEFRRTLLLVDELPNLFEEGAITRKTLHEADDQLEALQPSYDPAAWRTKRWLHYLLSAFVRCPFEKLERSLCAGSGRYGLISKTQLGQAGFQPEQLEQALAAFHTYGSGLLAEQLTGMLLQSNQLYFGVDQTFSLFLPRLKRLGGEGQPATVIFSGTAQLSPEVTANPAVIMLPSLLEESYQRLHIFVQRGDIFSATKTGMRKPANRRVLLTWLQEMLPQLIQRHSTILLVTYKEHSAELWGQLAQFHCHLLPYINGLGDKDARLPYFGGLNGSNLYQNATCIICLGLNRFEPQEYLSRTLALDSSGSITRTMEQMITHAPLTRLETLPQVMDLQDITLARDLVQLLFRSALRRHGEDTPIEAWLFQPPNGMLAYVEQALPGCQFQEVRDVPQACRTALAAARVYKGSATHAAVLLTWLQNEWDGSEVTPGIIRTQTGLSQSQFKEAKKHPDVQAFFRAQVQVSGSGQHTKYRRRTGQSAA